MRDQLTIAARFNGPPDSGNGGYVCGLLGSMLPGTAETTLRTPPPLDLSMDVVTDGDALQLRDGDTLVAESVPTGFEVEVPAAVSFDDAQRATESYAGFTHHAFPTCFVCGPQRDPGDGLRLFPGPVGSTGVVAAPWTPADDLGDADGVVRPEIMWAALDCPSYFGGPVGRLAVLGRLAADLRAPVVVDAPYVVIGWGTGSDGRKHFAHAAVLDTDGGVHAVSRATWIELRS